MVANLQDISILVVEDEADLRQLFIWDFEDKGIRVEVAGDYQDAVTKLNESTFDVILSDIKLPDKTGIALFEYIKDQNIPIKQRYFMTAFTSEEIDIDHLVVDRLFKKPLKTQEVIDHLLQNLS